LFLAVLVTLVDADTCILALAVSFGFLLLFFYHFSQEILLFGSLLFSKITKQFFFKTFFQKLLTFLLWLHSTSPPWHSWKVSSLQQKQSASHWVLTFGVKG
jgi:hypothetical protein